MSLVRKVYVCAKKSSSRILSESRKKKFLCPQIESRGMVNLILRKNSFRVILRSFLFTVSVMSKIAAMISWENGQMAKIKSQK